MPLLKVGRRKTSNKVSEQNGSGPSQASPSSSAPSPAQADPSSSVTSGPSVTNFDVAGLPVVVYGLSELTPSASSSTAPRPPDVCVSFHLHGRGGDAQNEANICRTIYRSARQETQRLAAAGGTSSGSHRELLVISFDARNHGHRMTHSLGQKGWAADNKQHAVDLYGMILGGAADVSFLIDLIPPYLFPHDDRTISQWCVTGKSLGGHSTWHVLKDEKRVTVGVNMIGCPDFSRLLDYRTRQAFLPNAPPTVPRSLKALIKARDPAQSKFDRWGEGNP